MQFVSAPGCRALGHNVSGGISISTTSLKLLVSCVLAAWLWWSDVGFCMALGKIAWGMLLVLGAR